RRGRARECPPRNPVLRWQNRSLNAADRQMSSLLCSSGGCPRSRRRGLERLTLPTRTSRGKLCFAAPVSCFAGFADYSKSQTCPFGLGLGSMASTVWNPRLVSLVTGSAARLQQIPHVPVRVGIGIDGEHRGEGRRSDSEVLILFPDRRRAVVVLKQDVGVPVTVHVA